MKLRILAEAKAELESARRYLNRQAPGLGRRFLRDVVETLAEVEQRPFGFPVVENLAEGTPYRRAMLRVFRYVLVYEVSMHEVVVVAVAHTSRAPDYWLGRRTT